MTASDSYSIAARAYLAKSHLQAAVRLVGYARTLEGEQGDTYDHGVLELAIGSVVLSALFLEGLINELYVDCADRAHSEGAKSLSEESRRLPGVAWPHIEGQPMLEKYCLALELLKRPPIDRSGETWASAKLIVRLRNALAHYKPKSVVISSDDPNTPITEVKLESQLKSRVPPNPVFASTTTHFYVKYLSAGCAAWAARAALAFADDFFSLLGVEPPYEFERSKMELRDAT